MKFYKNPLLYFWLAFSYFVFLVGYVVVQVPDFKLFKNSVLLLPLYIFIAVYIDFKRGNKGDSKHYTVLVMALVTVALVLLRNLIV